MKGNFTWKTFVLLGKPWFHPEKNSLQPIQTSEILISMVSAGASINHLPVITIIWLVLCRNHSQWVVTMTYVLPSVLPTFWKFYHLFCPQKMEHRYKSPSKCGCFTFYILFYLYKKWKIMEKSVIKSPSVAKSSISNIGGLAPGCVEMVPRGHCSVPFQSSTAE